MAIESVRELILQAIETALKASPLLSYVTRGKIDPPSIPDYPAAFIFPGADNTEPLLNDFSDRTWTIFIFLWVRSQDGMSRTIEEAIAAVNEAMNADVTLGGLVYSLFEASVHEPFPLNDLETDAGIVAEYQLRYRTPRTDPYTLA